MLEAGTLQKLEMLIARSLLNDAFVVVDVVDGITTALYRLHGAAQAELWQSVPDGGDGGGEQSMRFVSMVDLQE